MNRNRLLNTYFDNVTTEEVLSWIETQIPKRQAAGIIEINVDVVMKIEQDETLKKATEQAGLTIIDGKPLMWISRMRGVPVKEKISGSDLMPRVCSMAAQRGYSVFIIGGKEAVGKQACERLRAACPGLNISAYSPLFDLEDNEREQQRILELLNDSKPDIVFLCLGCPKQEKLWFKYREKLSVGVCVCVGAAVDFAAGNVSRAPKWVSNIGFEWLYRFFNEPKRLFKRYFIDDMQIFRLIWKYR